MNELETIKNIQSMIFEVRGKEVILDSDIAYLYGVETKRINEAVKNNPIKFPERYSFTLTDDESNKLLVENFDQKKETRGGKYKNPRVFTENGAYMLATILKSKTAALVTLNIMDAFVEMRHILSSNLIQQNYINNLVLEDHTKIKILEDSFQKLENPKINTIFYNGQIYDAYSLLVDILNSSKEKIIIIDNYIDKKLLDILKSINRKITIVTKNISKILKEKYESQYHNTTFVRDDTFHDRFIILDNKKLYICGASLKDIGKKCFYIGEIAEEELLNILLNKLENK